MHNLIGKPAEGEDFFDRERETRRLWERIDTDNVLLLAPRRVGKTSLMFRLRDGAEREGFHATYVSVADVTTETGGRFLFRSSLLRDFWLRRVSL